MAKKQEKVRHQLFLPADVTDASRRHLVTELLVKVNHLRDLLRQDVPPVLGITLGFNELDGDGSW